jgi:hypothetical protein
MYPYDSSTWRLLNEVERHRNLPSSAEMLLASSASVLRAQELLSGRMPYEEALRKLMGITGSTQHWAATAAQQQVDAMFPGVPRIEQAMLDLLSGRHQLDASLRAFIPTISLSDALSRAAVSVRDYPFPNLPEVAFGPMQATVTLTLGITSLVEQQLDGLSLRPELLGLWDDLAESTSSSTRIWDRLADRPERLARLPEFLREVPVLHAFEATRSTGLLLVQDPELVEVEPAPGLIATEAGELVSRLTAIHPKLADKYEGALDAFKRRGKDYVSQVSVSFRELYKHLFEIIAPPAAIAAWKSDVLPAKGPVTNKAYLRYIYRGQATAGYARMTHNEIEMVEQNLIVLNEGVHRLDPEFEYEHVRALIRRCEYCLLSVLHAHEISTR